MIPKITAGGASFKGAFQYYLHDKGADTCERVAWTQTENLRTRDVAKAWKAMAYTARAQERLKEASGQSRAGRKLEKPVFAFSLAWHPEQSPSQEHMLETARKAIAVLRLGEHEAVIVAHRDEPQKHVHVIVNRVHPLTGLAGDIRNSKRKLSDFAREYERTDGKIYCEQREANHQKRQEGEATHYRDPHIVKAWETTTNGAGFVAALKAQGYTLAQGNTRIVIVDPTGKAHNPARLLAVKAKDVRARLSDIDMSCLPRVQGVLSPERSLDQGAQRNTKIGANEAQVPSPDRSAAEAKERSRAAFEHIAETRLSILQKRQQQECQEMADRHRMRLDHSKKHLREYYDLPKRKAALEALHQKIKNAPWWKKVFRSTRKDRAELLDEVRSYRSALGRYRERLTQIGTDHEKALADVRVRHERERGDLEAHIAQQREAAGHSLSVPHEPAKERTADRLSSEFAKAQGPLTHKKSGKTREDRLHARSHSYPTDRTRL